MIGIKGILTVPTTLKPSHAMLGYHSASMNSSSVLSSPSENINLKVPRPWLSLFGFVLFL